MKKYILPKPLYIKENSGKFVFENPKVTTKDCDSRVIKAIDKLNKANGVYDQPKAQVNVQTDDSNITITFGGVPVDEVEHNVTDVPYTDVNDLVKELNEK